MSLGSDQGIWASFLFQLSVPILSTNRQEELDRFIGEASLSRLLRRLVAIEMGGDDYRREEEA
jgi:hypothetical protein